MPWVLGTWLRGQGIHTTSGLYGEVLARLRLSRDQGTVVKTRPVFRLT